MKKILWILILTLSFPLMTNALEEGIKINCQESNQEFKCEVIGYSSYEVSGIDYSFSLADGLTLKKFNVDESWIGEEYNHRIILYTGENKIGEFPIGEFIIEANSLFSEEQIKTEELMFVNNKFEDCYIIQKDVKKSKSKDNKSEIQKSSKVKYVIILLIVISIIAILIFWAVKKKRKKGVII